MFRTLLLGLSLVLATSASATSAAASDDAATRIHEYLRPYVEAGQLSGTLLVAQGDEILLEESFGMADYEMEVPNTPETRFCVASINKPMTIALLCRLAEQGRIAPEDSVSKYLPGFPRGDRITISHLLNHRAGIPHRVTTPEQETVPRTAQDMVDLVVAGNEWLGDPGEKSVYSSATYSVLARVLEVVGGASYPELLERYVCEPAGMTRTLHADGRQLVEGRARAYLLGPSGMQNAPLRDLSFLIGAGAVLSTSRDLFRLQQAILGGGLGEAAQMALIRENGFRWNGATSGYRAFADYDKGTAVTVIFTGNVTTGAIDRLREALPSLVAGEEVPPPTMPVYTRADVAPEILQRYEGTYEDERGRTLTLTVTAGTLYANDWIMIPTSDTTFFSLQDYHNVTAVRTANGSVEGLDWEWGDGLWPWSRVE